MAKQGMKRPDHTKLHLKNEVSPVPQIQGKARSGHSKANPIVAGTQGADLKVWHNVFDNDLAIENLTEDIPPEDR